MADRLFIDTWGWLSLRDRRERFHRKVTDYIASARSQGTSLFTTDYVLDETFTLCFKRLAAEQARETLDLMEEMELAGIITVERIHKERYEQTVRLRRKLLDKPDISFTDLSTMVVMEDLGIQTIITADAHFTHVGKAFRIVPE